MSLEIVLVTAGVLLAASVAASKLSTALRIPSLILFIVLGMLAGSEGFGGIDFDDAAFARSLGIVSLVFILFAGGLDTSWEHIRPIALAGISLATVGVLVTAAVVSVFAYVAFDVPPLVAFLLGAIVSPTDAAAVFGVLRARGLRLRRHLVPLLELESGSNDPMAFFLTVGVSQVILSPASSLGALLPQFFQQMIIGTMVGLLLGKGCAWFINRIRLEYDGLYAAVTVALAMLAYGLGNLVGGSGFLSAYLAGLVLGTHNFLHRIALIQFHDGLAWLLQIAVFITLGLLVFPSHLMPIAGPGILLALVLTFVARPVAVFTSLTFTSHSLREKIFVSWAGLRGAVPVILATIPLTAGVPEAGFIFNAVFFVVLASAVLQGITLAPVAHALSLLVARDAKLQERRVSSNLWEITLSPDSPAVGKQLIQLRMPQTALAVLLIRGDDTYIPRGGTVFHPGDKVLIATRKADIEELKELFVGGERALASEVAFPK